MATPNFAIPTPVPGGSRNTWGATNNAALNHLDKLAATSSIIGEIKLWPLALEPAATANTGTWLLCNGQAVSRTTYSDLFALIGTKFGAGDGNLTFNLPDFRARAPIGYNADTTLTGRSLRGEASTGGVETHTITSNEIPQHTHPIANTSHSHAITETAHTHAGSTADSGVTGITTNPHSHSIHTVNAWDTSTAIYNTAFGAGKNESITNTEQASVDINDSGHGHGLTIAGDTTGIKVDNAVIGITNTNNNTSTQSAHTNVQPFLTTNFIILALFPTL